jgi:ribosomal protein S18 acetylase RimI-like enzyme
LSQLSIITDRGVLERYLRRDTPLNIYLLGDLDNFFWPHTTWYGLRSGDEVQALALLYHPSELPTLIVLLNGDPQPSRELLAALSPDLPDRVYAHLTPGLDSVLSSHFLQENHGDHLKMILRDPSRLALAPSRQSVQLTIDDEEEVVAFYRASYPGNWFDGRMLETGHYWGIRLDGKLVAAGGVHVYSPHYRVAALGNIATHPDYRGRGLAGDVTAAICRGLLNSVEEIGLNVKADNNAAISCYRRLGFEVTATYQEILLTRRT